MDRNGRRVRILIADDHPVVRGGLRAAIQQDSDLEVVGESSTGEAAVRDVEQLNPDIAVIDLNMPQMNGIAAIRHIRKNNTRIGIVVLTAHDAEDLFQASMDAGANGYLLKDSAFIEIVAAIRAVCEGGYYVTKSMMGYLLNRQQQPQPLAMAAATQTAPALNQPALNSALNPVERRILSLIAQKRSSREIADEFGVSVRTIENRRTAICRCCSVPSKSVLSSLTVSCPSPCFPWRTTRLFNAPTSSSRRKPDS